jgi:hypothetical protein
MYLGSEPELIEGDVFKTIVPFATAEDVVDNVAENTVLKPTVANIAGNA